MPPAQPMTFTPDDVAAFLQYAVAANHGPITYQVVRELPTVVEDFCKFDGTPISPDDWTRWAGNWLEDRGNRGTDMDAGLLVHAAQNRIRQDGGRCPARP